MLCDRAHLLLISCDHPIQIQASARPAQHGIQSLNSFPKKNNESGEQYNSYMYIYIKGRLGYTEKVEAGAAGAASAGDKQAALIRI